jgi:hypothetical protein
MNAQQAKAKQSEAIARQSLRAQTDQMIVETWMATNGQPATREVTILRGWLMDELAIRMGKVDVWVDLFPALSDEQFDADGDRFGNWLEAESTAPKGNGPISPARYLLP